MSLEADRESRVRQAIRRLDRSVTLLEGRLQRRSILADARASSIVEADRARLAAELDQSRARERELAVVGSEASVALAVAISQLELALEEHAGG